MAKKQPALTSGISEPETVNDYVSKLDHPLKDVAIALRKLILGTDSSIGEGIAWNAPIFFYTGEMPEFDPKEYKRYIVGFNFFQKDCLRMIFLHGADVNDTHGIMEGDYKDGRRLVNFRSIEELNKKEAGMRDAVKQLLDNIKKHNS